MENIEQKKISRGTFIKGAVASVLGVGLLIKNTVNAYALDEPISNVNKGRFEFDKENNKEPEVVYDAAHLPQYFTKTIGEDGIVTITNNDIINENSFVNVYSENVANPAVLINQEIVGHTLTLTYDTSTIVKPAEATESTPEEPGNIQIGVAIANP